jgi:hypothetical protein
MTGTRDKSSAAKAPVTKAPTAKAGKSGTTTGGGATTGKASGSRATPATVQKSTGGGRASLSGRGSRARTLVVPETPLDAAGGAAGRRPTAVVKPAAFFAVVPRPVMIRGGKVDRSMKSPPELGDVGLLGAERAERQGGGVGGARYPQPPHADARAAQQHAPVSCTMSTRIETAAPVAPRRLGGAHQVQPRRRAHG